MQGREPGHASFAVADFSSFSDPKSRIGTLRYVLPSTETRTASPLPLVEPLPSDEKPPRDNPTAEVAVADRAPELVEAELLVLAAVAEAARGRSHSPSRRRRSGSP